MLELRPSCEHCNKSLPADAVDARICTFECTFCANCVTNVLRHNICPNCGGGFVPRPIRPANQWKTGAFLGKHPASTTPKHRPVDQTAYASLVKAIGGSPPEQR